MPNLSPNTRPERRRRLGFTLVELMVSLVMFGIVSGIILKMVRSQQRFYRGATEIIDVRSQLRQAAAIIPLDLRSVSTVSTVLPAGSPYQPSVLGSDISFMDDKEIRFRSTYGSGVACKVTNATNTITLVPRVLAKGNVLTSWYSEPAINDTVFLFDPGADAGAADDQWRPYRITAIAKLNTALACPGSPFLKSGNAPAGDDDRNKWSFTLASVGGSVVPLPASIGSGTVMRFTRSVVYGLYAPAGDTLWYLGYKTMQIAQAAGISTAGIMAPSFEPVSGPYRPWTAGGATNGIGFVYRDSTGNVTTAKDAVSRVDLTLRGRGTVSKNAANSANNTSWVSNSVFVDSLQISIAVRNRS
jgi:prepilin-type N-terminal cleavage/methylation domain-containing protein